MKRPESTFTSAESRIFEANSADLTAMLKTENSALANRVIPEAQSLKIDSEGLINLAGTAMTAGVAYAGLRMGNAN